MKPAISFQLLFLALATTAPSAQDLAHFLEVGHRIGTFNAAGAGRLALADVDGDGITDVVFSALQGNPLLLVAGVDTNGAIGLKQDLVVPYDGVDTPSASGFARVLAWSEDGAARIVTVGQNGTVRIYGQWPMVEVRRFDTQAGILAAAIGDIDVDGNDELVVLNAAGIRIYTVGAGTLIHEIATADNNDLALAQLDADPALEIIVGGLYSGAVLDGATFATDWQSPTAFGHRIAVMPPGASGAQVWATAPFFEFTGFDVYGAMPWGPVWRQVLSEPISSMAMAVDEVEGSDVILTGGSASTVIAFDLATQTERFRISNGAPISALAATDIDGDGQTEIIFSAINHYSTAPALAVADIATGTTRWQFIPNGRRYTAAAVGDTDGDGREDVLVAGPDSTRPGSIAKLDFVTGTEGWLSPADAGTLEDPFRIITRTIALARRANDARPRIVLAGARNEFHVGDIGRIVVLDPSDMSPTLQVGGTPADVFGPIRAATTYDWAQDGNDALLVAEGIRNWSPNWPRLRVLSASDGNPLWTSEGFGGPYALVKSVFVLPGTSHAEDTFVVATDAGLYGFGRSASSVSWELAMPNDGAAYVADGVGGPEILVFAQTGQLRFLDASTRTTLRSFTFDASFHAVQALAGDAGSVLAAADDTLMLIDGRTGTLRTRSAGLGAFDADTQVGAAYQGGGAWHIAATTEVTTYRYRLVLTDAIFSGDFEAAP